MSGSFFDKAKTTQYSLMAGAAVALIFLVFKKWNWALGVGLGTGAGLWNFYMLYKDFTHLFPPQEPGAADSGGERPPGPAGRRPSPASMAGKFFLRYLLLAVLFFLAFAIPGVHFVGFVLGFFLVHATLGVVSFLRMMRQSPPKS